MSVDYTPALIIHCVDCSVAESFAIGNKDLEICARNPLQRVKKTESCVTLTIDNGL
jgi:hypothetical protein